MNKQVEQVARQIAAMDEDQQRKIRTASKDELPEILQELGVTLPASSWWLRIIKIALYALGLILAGIGTTASAAVLTSNIM